MFKLRDIPNAIMHVIFPHICLYCEEKQALSDDVLCLRCKSDIPYTSHFDQKENDLEMRLSGRVDLEAGASLVYFYKEGKIQEVLHQLKYQRKRRVAEVFGQEFGKRWLKSKRTNLPDCVVPVPIFPKKEYQRGYNQSGVFARSLSIELQVPARSLLRKVKNTESQTRKSREERIKNLEGSIVFHKRKSLNGDEHVLLVDDVLTTGATLECCAQVLLKRYPDLKISVGTISMADY